MACRRRWPAPLAGRGGARLVSASRLVSWQNGRERLAQRIAGNMTDERIKRLLAELHEALPGADLDDETRRLVEVLDEDIHALSATSAAHVSPIVEQARELETRFAAEHPTLERFLRELIDTLTKMGV
jgi:hypothetical protein